MRSIATFGELESPLGADAGRVSNKGETARNKRDLAAQYDELLKNTLQEAVLETSSGIMEGSVAGVEAARVEDHLGDFMNMKSMMSTEESYEERQAALRKVNTNPEAYTRAEMRTRMTSRRHGFRNARRTPLSMPLSKRV